MIKKYILLLIIVALCTNSELFAAGSISGVSGDAVPKNQLTITGTGLGVKSPAAPVLFDDFDTGVADAGWTTVDSNWSMHSAEGQPANSTYCLRADLSGVLSVPLRKDFEVGLGDYFYASLDRRWDFDVQPLNLKFMRFHEQPLPGDEIGNGSFVWNYLPESGDREEFFCRTSISPHVDPLNPSSVYSGSMPQSAYPDYNDWLHEEFFAKMPDQMDECDSEMGYRVGNQYEYFPTNRCIANSGTDLPYISLFIDNFGKPNGIGTGHTCDDLPYSDYEFCNSSGDCSCFVPGSYVWVDNVYIDDTWMRVMIGNAADFASCTKLAPQPATIWEPVATVDTIVVTVNQGELPEGEAWLYVIDGNNIPSDQDPSTMGVYEGFAITLSSSSTAPVLTIDQASQTVSSSEFAITGSETHETGRTITSCTWINNQGGSGSLTVNAGVISGTVTGLSQGANVITFTLTDSESDTDVETRTFTYSYTPPGTGSATSIGTMSMNSVKM